MWWATAIAAAICFLKSVVVVLVQLGTGKTCWQHEVFAEADEDICLGIRVRRGKRAGIHRGGLGLDGVCRDVL